MGVTAGGGAGGWSGRDVAIGRGWGGWRGTGLRETGGALGVEDFERWEEL